MLARIADKPQAIVPHIRWTIRRDMPEVLAIENACFDLPWGEDEFIHVLRQGNCISMVADVEEFVRGFMVYELHREKLVILDVAVAPQWQGRRIGQAMVMKLVNKLSPQRRSVIRVDVRETNLEAQLFFRAMGFTAKEVLHDFYNNSDEDAYRFEYQYGE